MVFLTVAALVTLAGVIVAVTTDRDSEVRRLVEFATAVLAGLYLFAAVVLVNLGILVGVAFAGLFYGTTRAVEAVRAVTSDLGADATTN